MVELFGQILSRKEVAARSGSLSQFAGVRLMTLGDGVERGIRLLEFRTGTGLRFTVLVDRALDIADCEYKGQAIGWHSPSGFRHPALHEPEGEGGLGWLRSFSGLMLTCGLDHILFMDQEPTPEYHYAPRQTASHSIHGRISAIPARLTGYGERWEGDRCFLWAQGIVQQSTVFGEDLHLVRKIETEVGTSKILLNDRVINHGFYKTPHMFCYHINIGHPLLAKGSRYLAPIQDVVWAAHAGENYRRQKTGYQEFPSPRMNFHEQVWQHELGSDPAGWIPVAVVNDRLGLGLQVSTRKDQFPCQYQWQNFQAGHYALGIEPSTHHVLGNRAARERGEMIWLNHDEECQYNTIFSILDGAQEIASAESNIRAIAKQPEEDFPIPSNNHRPLRRQA